MSRPNPTNLRHTYKKLLRLASKYPSRNRDKIYKSIQEEFRLNASLSTSSSSGSSTDDDDDFSVNFFCMHICIENGVLLILLFLFLKLR